jgi:biotin carboxylase
MSGGAMNRIILEGTGINLVKETLKLYLGQDPILKATKKTHVYAKYLTINSRGRLVKVTGKNKASNYDGVKEVYVKPRKGAILTKPYSLGDRYAYVIATADNPEQAKEIALSAAKEIKFYLDPL